MKQLLFTPLAALASCATLLDPGPEMVPISSEPSGATIVLDGAQVGTTPTTVALARTARGDLRLRLDGYHDQAIQLDKHPNWTTVLNGFWGLAGLVGLVIDAAAGNTEYWDYEAVHVTMTPENEPAPEVWTRPEEAAKPDTEVASTYFPDPETGK